MALFLKRPVLVPSAPGNVAKRLSKLRFSCTSKTMCWIGIEPEPARTCNEDIGVGGCTAGCAHADSANAASTTLPRRTPRAKSVICKIGSQCERDEDIYI